MERRPSSASPDDINALIDIESRESTQAIAASPAQSFAKIGYFRWVICALLLFGVTKNYMDRQVLGVLKTTLQQSFGWNEIQYGHLVFVFQAAYAAGMVLVGRFVDRVGTRVGYALAMLFWSLASMGHLKPQGWFSAGLPPMINIMSVFLMSIQPFVMAPRPNVGPKLETVGPCQTLA